VNIAGVMHQEILLVGAAPGKDRMIQAYPPTDLDRAGARRMMEVFHERVAA
jgi:hypothetical protein